MVFCGKTSTAGFACFKKGIGVGKGLVEGHRKKLTNKEKKEVIKKSEDDMKKWLAEQEKPQKKPKTITLKKKKTPPKSQAVKLSDMEQALQGAYEKMAGPKKRGVKAGSKRGGYKKSQAVLLKEKKAAATALKKALEKAEKTGKKETRGVKKSTKRGKYKK